MRDLRYLAAILVPIGPAAAYPIAPRTLVTQVQEAELVVVANVVSVSASAGQDLWQPDSIAHLEVLETWKGRSSARLDVPFNSHMVCPAPPRYETGNTVVAFLSMHEGAWITDGLSWGTLYPEADELPVLRDATQVILALPEGDSRARIDLFVALASRRATRWDGLFELVPAGDQLHNYYRREKPRADASKLTRIDLGRIAAGFVAEPSADQSLTMTLLVLAGYPDKAFDRAAVGVIDAMLELDHLPWWFDRAFGLLLARVAPGLQVPTHPRFSEPDVKERRETWEPIRKNLDLGGPIPRIDLPSFGTPGVGRRTPS